MWQIQQVLGVPLKTALRWQDSQGRSRCTPSSSKPVDRWSKATVIGGTPAAPARSDGTSTKSAVVSNAMAIDAPVNSPILFVGRLCISTSLRTHHLSLVHVDRNHVRYTGNQQHEKQRDMQHL